MKKNQPREETTFSNPMEAIGLDTSAERCSANIYMHSKERYKLNPVQALKWLETCGTSEQVKRFKRYIQLCDVECCWDRALRTNHWVYRDPKMDSVGIHLEFKKGRKQIESLKWEKQLLELFEKAGFEKRIQEIKLKTMFDNQTSYIQWEEYEEIYYTLWDERISVEAEIREFYTKTLNQME